MKFPSLTNTLKLLKPFRNTRNTVESVASQIDQSYGFTLYDKIEEIVSIANFQSDSLAVLMKFNDLTEVQQQLTIVSLIEHNMVEALELILYSDYDVNFLLKGQTPLHFAIKDHNLNMVRVLIKYKADLELKDNFKETALMCAVRTGNAEIIKYLLKEGANTNTQASDSTTPLGLAIHCRDAVSVKILKKYGAQLGDSYLVKGL